MKKLIFVLFLFGGYVNAQVTATLNPFIIDPSSTSTFEVNLGGVNNVSNPSTGVKYPTEIMIWIPASNVGTVQFNRISTTMTNCPAEAPGASGRWVIITIRDKFYIKFSNSADFVWIYW